MRNDIYLEDTTLRDGEQAPGVAFSKAIKLKILDRLIALGVRWAEPGIPAMGGEELDALRAMLERKDEITLVAWNRGIRGDVAFALDLGFKAVHVALPTSNLHLEHRVGRNRSWALERIAEVVKYAKDRGAYVSASAEDVGRTEPSFLQEYAGVVHEAGGDRLRLADTIGILTPEAYAERVAKVCAAAPIDVQTHCHNDFGLGVANTLAGLQAGARVFHACVNGMGERAGMPDLATLVLALRHLYGCDIGLDTTGLRGLAALVAEASHQPLPAWQPVVGENVFAHESGVHVMGMLKHAETFEPYGPEEVSGTRRYVIGKHVGRALLRHVLERDGVAVDEGVLNAALATVRSRAIDRGGALSETELHEIYHDLAVAPAASSGARPTGARP